MKNTVEINFKDVELCDLSGEVILINNLHELVSNHLYRNAMTVPAADAARALYYGDPVSVDFMVLTQIIEGVSGMIPIINDAIMKYLNEKLNNLKSE